MVTDDLPWPELGNVSRGATRGNQGSKGVLGPPDEQGRAVLQLRVQPGVLAVKLNPTATVWYRTLDNEVQRALKETKTYWRKARRRQDYDARADQDHMELHEWLQQLKDKCMAHLELLLQKGEITGPPYIMPDNLEFTFMRGFIERQRSGVPHNPRLRGLPRSEQHRIPPEDLVDDDLDARGSPDSVSSPLKSPSSALASRAGPSSSPTWSKMPSDPSSSTDLLHRIEAAQNTLRQSRSRLRVARTATQDAYGRYKHCTDQEHILESEVQRAEERLDELTSRIPPWAIHQQYVLANSIKWYRGSPSFVALLTPLPHLALPPSPHTVSWCWIEKQSQYRQTQEQIQPPSSTSTPIATSAPSNGVFDQERAYAAVGTLPSSSQAHRQHQQQQHTQQQQQQQQHQQHQQLTPYHHAYHLWPGVGTPFHAPPQRPASSVSVSSAPGGLSMEIPSGQRYAPELLRPGGAGASGSRSGEDWTAGPGPGVGSDSEAAAMMHTTSRVASPQRKHPREWETASSAQQQTQHMAALRDTGDVRFSTFLTSGALAKPYNYVSGPILAPAPKALDASSLHAEPPSRTLPHEPAHTNAKPAYSATHTFKPFGASPSAPIPTLVSPGRRVDNFRTRIWTWARLRIGTHLSCYATSSTVDLTRTT
ncbi:hypothetical protein ACEPAF_8690 [Sanghuangporus sanghuang]